MSQKDNISQELKDLESSLAGRAAENCYTVPAGYFEGLIGQVLGRIKAEQAGSAAEELSYLAPTLGDISRKMPYSVPAGFFEQLEKKIADIARGNKNKNLSAREELEALSPLLSGLKKENPYQVPEGYFDTVTSQQPVAAKKAKVVSLVSKKWFRYAAAAAVVLIAGTIAILSLSKPTTEKEIFAKVSRDVNKMNETEKDNLVDFLNAGLSGEETAQVGDKTNDFKKFLEDVPEEELNDFRKQNEDLEDFLLTSE